MLENTVCPSFDFIVKIKLKQKKKKTFGKFHAFFCGIGYVSMVWKLGGMCARCQCKWISFGRNGHTSWIHFDQALIANAYIVLL